MLWPALAERQLIKALALHLIRAMAFGLISTKWAAQAPRLKASRPKAPVPAKRSNTEASCTFCWRMLKSASLQRSEVGRISLVAPGGDLSFRPRATPLIILKVDHFCCKIIEPQETSFLGEIPGNCNSLGCCQLKDTVKK